MKSIRTYKIVTPAIFLILTMLACNLPGQMTTPTPDLGMIVAQTQTAMAVSWYLTGTAPAQIPASTETPQSPTSTVGIQPTIAQPTPIVPQVTEPPQVTPPAPSQPTNIPTSVPSCSNAARFVAETVPDGSAFNPGQQFMKSWTLQNVGTCTWTPDYALNHVNGDPMGGPSPLPIGQTVPPGATIQVNLPQTAPSTPGIYQGYWKLRSQSGQLFGLGNNAEVPFWVKISVGSGSSSETPFTGPQALGKPDWVETFDSKRSPWFLGTDSGIDYDIKNGALIITTSKATGDQWRVAQPGFVSDFYMQAIFITGATCSGKDGYGLLVRAPMKASYVVNSGYVFSFSCDGKYRIYRQDNGAFQSVQNWTSNAAIKSGPNQTNTMGVYANGDELRLYANGILLMQFTDNVYADGLFGLLIRAENNNFQVKVDEVKIWDLD